MKSGWIAVLRDLRAKAAQAGSDRPDTHAAELHRLLNDRGCVSRAFPPEIKDRQSFSFDDAGRFLHVALQEHFEDFQRYCSIKFTMPRRVPILSIILPSRVWPIV